MAGEQLFQDSEGAWICKKHKVERGSNRYGSNCYRCKVERNNQLQAELQTAKEENERLKKAISPFVGFKSFLDALRENQCEKPLTKHDCIASVMGSGGSDYIWYGDLERAEQALKEDSGAAKREKDETL